MAERRILRVFPHRTSCTPDDDLVRIGPPGLYDRDLRGKVDEVHVSCVFTWHQERCRNLAFDWRTFQDAPVKIGGPGWMNDRDEPPGSKDAFTPGLYVKPGITFTSRGCPNKCPWCLVPAREGPLRELAIQPGHIVQDNNLLACSMGHFRAVCKMLAGQKQPAEFRGGFEAERLTDEHVAILRDLRVKSIYLASDGLRISDALRSATERLSKHWSREVLSVYVLTGYYAVSTPERVERRCLELWDMGLWPFVQLYRPADDLARWSKEWKAVARRWSSRQIIRARMKARAEAAHAD